MYLQISTLMITYTYKQTTKLFKKDEVQYYDKHKN